MAIFSKQQYDFMASVISGGLHNEAERAKVAKIFALHLASDHPNFNTAKWFKACGVTLPKETFND